MTAIHSIAVFCGSRSGHDPVHAKAGRVLGRGLAALGIRLVYGGGRVGLMGVVADAVLEAGGSVLGVIPDFLMRREVAHQGVTEMVVTDSMHDRKRRMYEESDAFLTMPGGIGTLDETIEVISWRQLGLHDKPILLCDVAGSAAPLARALDATIALGFATEATRSYFEVLPDVPAVLRRLEVLGASPTSPEETAERL
jgi:uncharacterized protein (TIGR00730 family)